MALLSDALKEKEFDVRMVERALSKGLVLQADIDKAIAKIRDDAENGEFISMDEALEGIHGKSGLRG